MARTPEEELDLKLSLEGRLRRQLLATYRQLSRVLRAELEKSGIVPDLRGLAMEPVEQGLVAHSVRVQDAFSGTINDELPEDLRLTEDEEISLAAVLAGAFAIRATGSAAASLDTLQRNATRATTRARDQVDENATGRLTRKDIPRLAQRNLMRRQRPNAGTSARMETQFAAEETKAAEVQTLLREIPEADIPSGATKKWRSQGDSLVRTIAKGSKFDHLAADGQEVDTNLNFVVNGEKLRHPGDLSHGASVGNVARCRCSAIYNAESIKELRQLAGPDLIPDLPIPFPTVPTVPHVTIDV